MSDFNLGTVTAYGYAKDKGYTGTEDEYAELMASYADVAEQAAESAEQAAASATTATAKASEAAQSATAAASSKTAAETAQGGAETAAQTATTKASEASASATTASGKATEATTAATTATSKASEATTAATTATTKAGEASTSATNAAASATRAQEILDSIPEDYSQLSDDVSDLKDGFNDLKDDLSYLGIANAFDGNLYNGYWNASGVRTSYNGDVCPLNKIDCSDNANVVIIGKTNVTGIAYFVSYFDGAGTTRIRRDTGSGVTYTGVAPIGAKYVVFTFEKNGLTKNDIQSVQVYVNNSIYELKQIADNLTEKTKNMLAVTNVDKTDGSTYPLLLDLGENKTFSNGVIFSFEAINAVFSATNNALVDLQESDGTHHYCTGNSFYDVNGKHFDKDIVLNGRFYTKGFTLYESSITFRYVYARLGSITSGKMTNFMLNAGTEVLPFADSTTAIDYDARNLIRDDGADYLAQSVYKINDSTIKPVTLLHFSDIHGDTARLIDIMDFANTHDNITDILHTGDTVAGIYSDGLAWWDSVSGSQKILNVIGNHDAITSQTDPTIIDMETIAETFIEPYVSNWGVTSYTDGTTYYYKDYDNGVRLICLDCMHITDNTQLDWLQTVLNGALSTSKHVVIGFHYYAYPHTVIDCEFSPKVDVASVQASIPNTVLDLVKTFQTGGGKFVCYLTGHNHYDMIVTPSNYPEQLVIGITCATNVYAQAKFSDQTRRGSRFANAFNLVTINPKTYTVSVRRIGADMDMLGRERRGFAYNYSAHTLLF